MALTSNIRTYQDADADPGIIYQKFVSLSGVSILTELVANTDSTKQIQILAIILATSTAGLFTIKTDTDNIAIIALAANTSLSETAQNSERPLFVANLGKNISITPSTTITTGGIYIQYRIR